MLDEDVIVYNCTMSKRWEWGGGELGNGEKKKNSPLLPFPAAKKKTKKQSRVMKFCIYETRRIPY